MDETNGQTEPAKQPSHGPKVISALERTAQRKDKALEMWLETMKADDGALFPVDFVASGAVKRCLSQCHALKVLIESWNLLCSRSLLRLQIDTALRFSALWLVDKPHDLASEILKGRRIDQIKDRDGAKMTDAHLVARLAPDHPWLPSVYKRTSGYIHFSGEHLFSPMESLDEESREVSFTIHETDTKYPEFSWLEVIDCFNAATDIFLYYLRGWIKTKEAGTGSK